MNNRYNLSNLEALFRDYLKTCSISKVSIKNYASDLKHFLGWFMYSRIGDKNLDSHLDQFIASVSQVTIEEYVEHLQNDSIPVLTINRRLSTLRKFFSFCIKREILVENPMATIKTLEKPAIKRETKDVDIPVIPVEREVSAEEDFIEFMKMKGEDIDSSLIDELRLYIG